MLRFVFGARYAARRVARHLAHRPFGAATMLRHRREAVIAANALVTREVPPRAVVIGNPAQVANFNGSRAYMVAEE
jgi:serine acetyltransferase